LAFTLLSYWIHILFIFYKIKAYILYIILLIMSIFIDIKYKYYKICLFCKKKIMSNSVVWFKDILQYKLWYIEFIDNYQKLLTLKWVRVVDPIYYITFIKTYIFLFFFFESLLNDIINNLWLLKYQVRGEYVIWKYNILFKEFWEDRPYKQYKSLIDKIDQLRFIRNKIVHAEDMLWEISQSESKIPIWVTKFFNKKTIKLCFDNILEIIFFIKKMILEKRSDDVTKNYLNWIIDFIKNQNKKLLL